MYLASRLNTFVLSFERNWLFVQTQLASRSNAFSFSLQHISYNGQTCPGCGVNAFIRGANEFGQKTRHTLCQTDTVYDGPASIDLIISSFSSIVNTTFLRLNLSAILCTSLKFYSTNNVTTAHVQSSQGCVQIIEGSYNRLFR